MGYTSQNKQGVQFSEHSAWLAACNRLQIIIHAFEIETRARFQQIERSMHHLRGYKPEQRALAMEKETTRRNGKLNPLGELEGTSGSIKLSFKW